MITQGIAMLTSITSLLFRTRPLLAAVLLVVNADARADTAKIPMHEMQTGVFYIKGNLDNLVDTDMLLDTGSGYVSLSQQTFAIIRDDVTTVFQRHITGIMADGHKQSVPIYRIGELKLASDCVLHDIEVAVFSNTSRDILGLNALMRIQPITLQLNPPLMTATCS